MKRGRMQRRRIATLAHLALLASLATLLAAAGCQRPEQPASGTAKPLTSAAATADESQRFPTSHRVSTNVVSGHVFEKDWLPAGNTAAYQRGSKSWRLFLIKAASPEAAGLLLFDVKKALGESRYIAHFGGYSGSIDSEPWFVFAKGTYVAGVVGLAETDADKIARTFAATLN